MFLWQQRRRNSFGILERSLKIDLDCSYEFENVLVGLLKAGCVSRLQLRTGSGNVRDISDQLERIPHRAGSE